MYLVYFFMDGIDSTMDNAICCENRWTVDDFVAMDFAPSSA